ARVVVRGVRRPRPARCLRANLDRGRGDRRGDRPAGRLRGGLPGRLRPGGPGALRAGGGHVRTSSYRVLVTVERCFVPGVAGVAARRAGGAGGAGGADGAGGAGGSAATGSSRWDSSRN